MRKTWMGASACAASLLLFGTVVAQNQPSVRVQPGGGAAVEPNDNAAAQDAANDAAADQQNENFYRASELIGTTVKGQGGENLGQIEDLLIDRRNQQIKYFILSDGQAVGARGNRRNSATVTERTETTQSNLHVIPWTVAKPQFSENREDRFVTVPLEPQRLQQAPAYTWQQLQAPQAGWVQDVNRFYGVGPGNVAVPPDSKVKIQRDGDVKIKRND